VQKENTERNLYVHDFSLDFAPLHSACIGKPLPCRQGEETIKRR
jgi:hypothetical protein